MDISIGSDHAGFELKTHIIEHLQSKNNIIDHGAYENSSVDYPDFAHKLAASIISNKSTLGILICGSGNGINMTVNKHKNIRAALCWTNELAQLARNHNNANVLSLPARFISTEEGLEIVDAFLRSDFEGGRHQRRINKINCE